MIETEVIHVGAATGRLVVLDAPLSFWGGVRIETGEVIDKHHPQKGEGIAGRIVALPGGRGSSSSSSVIVECVRRGTAPAALLVDEVDAIMVIGAVVAKELYGIDLPILKLGMESLAFCEPGDTVQVVASADGGLVRRLGGRA